MTTPRGGGIVAVGAVLALASAIGLQVARDRLYGHPDTEIERILYVRSGPAMQRIALEFDALAADVYWIRAIQHFGGDRRSRERERKYELLYPMLDLTTTLDPYFTIAYRFGAIFLSEAYPGGAGRPDQAIALLRKGIAAEPGKWQYFHDIAFVHFWHLRDYQAAAVWFQRAAEQPNAPNWLPPMAASVLAAGGDRTAARFLWQQILKSEEAWLRQAAERRLLQLDALDAIETIEARIRRVQRSPGEAYSWDMIIRRGGLRGIPVDPTGTPFELDPRTGRVSVSRQSPLWPMPDDTHRGLS